MDEKIRVDCNGEKEVGGRRRFRVLLVLTLVYVAALSLSAQGLACQNEVEETI